MPSECSPHQGWSIGAVGHRYLPVERLDLLRAISRALSDLAGGCAGEPGGVELLVSVAEGADRLFIEAAASLGIPYTCVLPCSPSCFERDFVSPHSVMEFRRLLGGARRIVQPEDEPAERVTGYLWVNHYILDRADALIAVWDGYPANGPGGTGESIEDAAERRIPVIWIPTEAPHEPVVLTLATSTFE